MAGGTSCSPATHRVLPCYRDATKTQFINPPTDQAGQQGICDRGVGFCVALIRANAPHGSKCAPALDRMLSGKGAEVNDLGS